jgi:hypothetical protein
VTWSNWEPRLVGDGVEVDVSEADTPEIIQAKVRVALLKSQIALLHATPVVEVEGYEELDLHHRVLPAKAIPTENMPLLPPLEAPPPTTAGATAPRGKKRIFSGPDPDPRAYDFVLRGATAGPNGLGVAVVDTLQPPPDLVNTASYIEAGPRYSGQLVAITAEGEVLPPLAGLRLQSDAEELARADPATAEGEPTATDGELPATEEPNGDAGAVASSSSAEQ